jgi:hypothetical protein
MTTTYTRWIHHGEALEDMVDNDEMYKITQFCRMQRGMWIMQLHGMVVSRKRSKKTNTYWVWQRMKALEMMGCLNSLLTEARFRCPVIKCMNL